MAERAWSSQSAEQEALPCASAHSLNFAVSDGHNFVATRFRSCPHEEPPSLYYAVGVWDANAGVRGSTPFRTPSQPRC